MWTETGLDGVDPHPQAALAVQRTATLLRELGHDVREIAVPAGCDEPLRRAIKDWFASAVAVTASTLVPAQRRHLLTPYISHLLAAGELLSGTDAMMAQSILARYASTFLTELVGFDIAVTPTTNGPPAPVGHYLAHGVESVAGLMLEWSCYTPWVNLAGMPAVTLPSHLDSDGLPLGVQLVGRQRHDAELLALAAQLEGTALWTDVHPPCWHQ